MDHDLKSSKWASKFLSLSLEHYREKTYTASQVLILSPKALLYGKVNLSHNNCLIPR